MNPCLLDSDTVSFFLKGIPSVREKVAEYVQTNGLVQISIISYYEILQGLLFRDAHAQLSRFEEMLAYCEVLPFSKTAARKAAEVAANLRRQNLSLDHRDTMIAGIALANDLALVTNNQQHFSRIPGLQLETWKV
jgi:tRNA(fMet)-specific endonuclease VapC